MLHSLARGFRRILVSSLLVLVTVAPKIARVLYISAYLENYGTSPVDTPHASHASHAPHAPHASHASHAPHAFMHTPAGVLGCAFAWKLWQRGFWGTCTTSMFLATVSLAATITLSAQLDAFVFHMHSFRIKDECRLIEDTYMPGFFAGIVPSSVKNTAAALLGLECSSTTLYNFRSRTAALAEDYFSARSLSAEWGDFLLLVCCSGFLAWLMRACLYRVSLLSGTRKELNKL